MQLGNFSISLTVKDIEVSRRFYEKFGFEMFMGDASSGWLILKNHDVVIGLFQGMFEKNMLTFNPGWDGNAQPLDEFTDVRELQKRLKAQGVVLATEADEMFLPTAARPTTTISASLAEVERPSLD
jgi:hypothetical protein